MKIKIKTWDEMVSIGKETQFLGEPCIGMINDGIHVSFLQEMEDSLPEDRIVDLDYKEKLDIWELPDGDSPIGWEIYPCMVDTILGRGDTNNYIMLVSYEIIPHDDHYEADIIHDVYLGVVYDTTKECALSACDEAYKKKQQDGIVPPQCSSPEFTLKKFSGKVIDEN